MLTMENEQTGKKRSVRNALHRIPQNISSVVENFFYRLGYQIARHPLKWILGCTVIVLICLFGLYRFRQEKNPLKLWIPPDSDFVKDTEWVMSNFRHGQQVETMILTGENILHPEALYELNEITKRILTLQTASQPAISWSDVCFKVPIISGFVGRSKRDVDDDDFFDQIPDAHSKGGTFDPSLDLSTDLYCPIVNSLPKGCLLLSILDIWDFDSVLIKNQTQDDIINKFNSAKTSPTLGHPMNFTDLLGGVTRDEGGRVIGATAVETLWMVHINFSDVKMNESGNDAGTADWITVDILNWEALFLRELASSSRYLNALNVAGTNEQNLKLWYRAGRSWGDISSSTMFQDTGKIVFGILLMSVYVQIILSRFNWVEWRFCLTSVGLLCVGGAFVVAIGLCSLFGVPYGPVHTSLPFMLMGLGVDDIFVMMASWDQILSHSPNRLRSLAERIGMMLSHAGAAIFVTSFTDVVAFIIGASTILPSLQSFCIYAAVGVMMTFLLQVTFFVAFFTLDMKRVESKRNGVIPCIVHEKYELIYLKPSKSISWRFIDFLYSKIILTVPGKIVVILVTIGVASFGILGCCQLEQWFDPEWFIPTDTYLSDFIKVKNEQYPGRGHPGSVFIGDIKYHEEFPRIMALTESLKNLTTIDHVDAWPHEFADFMRIHFDKDVTKGEMNSAEFHDYLSKFLFGRSGGKYQGKFHFDGNLTCGVTAPRILVSIVDFSFVTFNGPEEWIPAMDGVKNLANHSNITGLVFVWSRIFASWVTDKVIAEEVTRNLILALVCVMATTAVLIAEPQTCFWILLCVLLTLLDVCGFMFYWGLTIDIVSCIGLELAVGLSVDYAAHVAHAFLNNGGFNGEDNRFTRTLTAVRHIGAAVTYGAGSTLLSQSMMAFSEAYVFRSFFKIFFMVITFGLWHGLILLPVVLSTIGPRSLHSSSVKRNETEDVRSTKETEELEVSLNKLNTDE
ncbi:NPC intracellular cholesterol transporter 1-like [Venturia canescens]|uniref:NPC intracellular cholesterol transporter 1-like n=1 Tax=Venturia canescens TaxID=32260 RepID=UPI001C9C3DC2|nr:NPC intracellular cholesterol transporter 1-like [Venturia canescens]